VMPPPRKVRPKWLSTRKLTIRGHGSMVGGTANDMPPPPASRRGPSVGRSGCDFIGRLVNESPRTEGRVLLNSQSLSGGSVT